MIKFSWKKINDRLNWNAFATLQFFYFKQGIDLPASLNIRVSKDAKNLAKSKYIPGPCFILNINEALHNATDPWHLYSYLELAAKRNLFDYKLRGALYLPVVLIPDQVLPTIEFNPMVEINDNKLYFKYEQR